MGGYTKKEYTAKVLDKFGKLVAEFESGMDAMTFARYMSKESSNSLADVYTAILNANLMRPTRIVVYRAGLIVTEFDVL